MKKLAAARFVTRKGTVKSFNVITGLGKVSIGKSVINFHSTFFHSNLPTRFPRVGEKVKVVYSDGKPVSVRSTS